MRRVWQQMRSEMGKEGRSQALRAVVRKLESTLGAMGNYWNVLGKAVTWSDDGFRRLFCTSRWNACERMRGDRDDQGEQQGLS